MIKTIINSADLIAYNTPSPAGVPHALNYSDVVDAIGGQIVDKFLIIGLVFLIYSYWNRCGMRRSFNGGWDSYPRRLMVHVFKDKAEGYTEWINGFLDGLTSSVALVSIAMWIMYRLGW